MSERLVDEGDGDVKSNSLVLPVAQVPVGSYPSQYHQQTTNNCMWTSSYPYYLMNIPRKFARFNGLIGRSCEIVVVDEQRRSWMASLRHKESDGQVYIGCGWRNICIGNKLKAMDCVVIEFIGNGTMPVFKLHKVEDDEDDK
ncbi:DNA binding protein [Hibiscus syriacus]|uniref:DNA binding protein n=1 Tax=Hibiscus syriacus TaxID=106335 RepID=A0A6A3AFG6_HIBSY|nr:DNA binding protein [Hibiscus syriacus]